jgi:acetyl esterase/lipase
MKLSSAHPTRRPPRLRGASRRLIAAGRRSFGRLPVSLAAMLDGASKLVPGSDRAKLVHSGSYGDDPRQALDVWAPDQRGGAPLAVIVFFYGGGWESGERRDFGFVARALAARGYLVVVPDYRRSPDHLFPAFIEDGADAVRWALHHAPLFGGDPQRLVVSGHSAGAHLAALLAYDRRYGVADNIRAAALLSGPFDFDPMAYPETRIALGCWPDRADVLPVTFARADAPPTLLVSGTGDVVVRARNSQSMARALTAAGAEVTLKLYRGQTHSDLIKSFSPLFRRANPALDDLTAFLDDTLAAG